VNDINVCTAVGLAPFYSELQYCSVVNIFM